MTDTEYKGGPEREARDAEAAGKTMTTEHKPYRPLPRPAYDRGWDDNEWRSIVDAALVAKDPAQPRRVRMREAGYVRRCALEAERALRGALGLPFYGD